MTVLTTLDRQVRRAGAVSRNVADRVLSTMGVVHAPARLAREAQDYWRTETDERWRSNSHWRDADAFAGGDLWSEVGRGHLAMFERLVRVTGRSAPFGPVLEWGCGGGANAVHFAPIGSAFVGVDVVQESIDECGRQVAAVTDVPFRPLLVDVDDPEAAVARLTEPCDLFTSFYVFELITSPEYGARLLRVAHRVLADDGLAFVQIKYDTGSWLTAPRRRNYRAGLANMTTYRIDAFWTLARECGFTPEAVYVVPRNELDERYAYFLLSKGA